MCQCTVYAYSTRTLGAVVGDDHDDAEDDEQRGHHDDAGEQPLGLLDALGVVQVLKERGV